MWESILRSSRGGLSTRRLIAYALSAFVAVFLSILISTTSVHAADAGWTGKDITYQGHSYSPTKTTNSSEPSSKQAGSTYYDYIEVTAGGGLEHAIYFPNGTNSATSSTATYSVYQINSFGQVGAEVTQESISITPLSNTSATSPAGDAVWTNGTLVYNGNTYTGNSDGSPLIVDGSSPPLPQGTQYYEYDAPSGTTSLLYFPAGVDRTSAKSASWQSFDVTTDSFGSGLTWGNPSKLKTVPIDISSQATGTVPSTSTSSCTVQGIGWIVCPLSNFLAQGMDNVFNMLKGFLVVHPLSTDTSGGLYQAWSYVRSIANVAFVIAFLLIIYSQITNFGIDNYSIKKLLPRLILAAILVNLSYFICAIAVDLSNILGASLQDALISIRQSLTGPNTNSIASWQSVTGFILAGGAGISAAAVGVGSLVIVSGASIGAALILLLPMLLALLLAVLVALVVLAARQALIIILIIVAPLAFVAYLLPNTEKWFKRWREIFTVLLVFFPLFALIFGGSQLAAFLIIQNADQIDIILLAMFVQVAPLVLTPLLVRFSGDIVGKVAGVINNPRKGLVDRTRAWAKQESEHMAARNLSRQDPVRRNQLFRRFALGADQDRRIREARKNMYKLRSDALWANSADFNGVDQDQRFANDQKTFGESRSEAHYIQQKNTPGAARNLDVNLRNVKADIEAGNVQSEVHYTGSRDPRVIERRLNLQSANDRLAAIKSNHDSEWEELRAGRLGNLPGNANIARMMAQAQEDTQRLALNAFRNASAKRVQQNILTESINTDLQRNLRIDGQVLSSYAGGIQGLVGAERIRAQALTEAHKAGAELIANADAIIEHSNLSAAETLEIAKNISVKGIVVNNDIRQAAIKRVASNGVIPHIDELLRSIDLSPSGNADFRLAMIDALKNNANRQKFIGFGILDQLTQGIPGGVSESTIDSWIAGMLIDGKLSAKELATQDKDTLARVASALGRLPRTPALSSALVGLRQEINNLHANDQLWDAAGERKQAIRDIESRL